MTEPSLLPGLLRLLLVFFLLRLLSPLILIHVQVDLHDHVEPACFVFLLPLLDVSQVICQPLALL